jgi:uncharacterized protein (TIGR02147 family)
MLNESAYANYQTFLRHRYNALKATKPSFSARFFAKKAGIASFSYFRMVVTGERKLSSEYAKKFARGLSLSGDETKLLLKLVDLEHADTQPQRSRLLKDIESLVRLLEKDVQTLSFSHVEILSDLTNLKLYLLAQSKQFRPDPHWILKRFGNELNPAEIPKRIALLLKSGLWKLEGDKITTLAPVVKTGDCLQEKSLAQTHVHILEAAKNSIQKQSPQNRILGGRSFLFDKKRLPEVAQRIEKFKAELETEFEDLNAESVYECHLSFFEL